MVEIGEDDSDNRSRNMTMVDCYGNFDLACLFRGVWLVSYNKRGIQICTNYIDAFHPDNVSYFKSDSQTHMYLPFSSAPPTTLEHEYEGEKHDA